MSRMGISRLWGKITVLIAVCGWGLSAQAKYDGGSGTQAEPYRISAVSDWQELMATPADWASNFVLTADIDLNGVSITPIAPDTSTSYRFQGTPFTGVFDGNDYVVRNVDVNMPGSDYVGLFGCVGTGGQIKNLGVDDISVFGRDYVGGLVGGNGGTISNCYSAGAVSGPGGVGGLVGRNDGTISNCYSSSSVDGTSYYAGGLVGRNDGTISNCYSTGTVSGSTYVGGLAGYNDDAGTISNCYSTGPVSSEDTVGGLVGYNYEGNISNCYSSGSVSGTGYGVGGLVGMNYRVAIGSSFWDVNTSGRLGSSGGKGLTTEQMKSLIIYCNAGWAGKGWVIEDGLDYPRLAWEGTAGVPIPEPEPVPLLGDGTEQSPYQIWTAEDFAILSWHSVILDKHIELKADLDLAGIALYPIADLAGFMGVFDGNDYVIRNAEVNLPGSDYVGLFGCVGTGGQIKNLGVEDISILGSRYVAGLVGSNSGNISNCYSTGSVSGTDGTDSVGGLVGLNHGTISNCYSGGAVSGRGGVGGLVGFNHGTISNCYSSGSVGGDKYVGGLTGYNFSTISNCYATGSVSGAGSVGGLVGWNYWNSTIINCHSSGSVSGAGSVGGLVGWNYWGSTIINCYSSGSVSGGSCVGGLVGTNCDAISECYSTGPVTGIEVVGGLVGRNGGRWPTAWHGSGTITNCYSSGSVSGGSCLGGLVGNNEWGTVTASFWDVDVNQDVNGIGNATDPNVIGESTTNMQKQSTFADAGWDFIEVWDMGENQTYPFLRTYAAGDINHDGVVDFRDIAYLAESWLRDVR